MTPKSEGRTGNGRATPIRAVFFDSGNTLMRPIDNRWLPGFRFFEICEGANHLVPDDDELTRACDKAFDYLHRSHDECPDVSAEAAQFSTYYRILFECLDRSVPVDVIDQLTHSIVHEINFEPYPETERVLKVIAGLGIPMAVITNAWPSVRSKFEQLGYLHYFQAFVVSAEQRCIKPDMGMFHPALEVIGVTPDQVLFIDDSIEIIDATKGHGFKTLLADYDDEHPERRDRITGIGQVLNFIDVK